MPLYTPYYQLGERQNNEPYMSAVDRSRFTIIDNELAFLADLVGDGVISGWDVSVDGTNANLLHVSYGEGALDRFFVRSYGPLDLTLSTNGTYYVFMQRALGVLGGYSGFSAVEAYVYGDTTPPAAPNTTGAAAFAVAHKTFQSIGLQWTANIEIDLAGYEVYRNTLNSAGTAILIATTTTPSYTDTGLEASTGYFYWVTAFDLSGNASTTSIINNPSTPIVTLALSTDSRIPGPPSGLKAYAGNAILQVAWLPSIDTFVGQYQIIVQQINLDGTLQAGDTYLTGASNSIFTVTGYGSGNLLNKTSYSITVASVSANNPANISVGISVVGVPIYNAGPNEVSGLTATAAENNGTAAIILNWSQGTGSNGTAGTYIVTVTQNNLLVSSPMTFSPSGSDPQTMTVGYFPSVTNGVLANNPVQEKTLYSIRVRGTNLAGNTNIGVVTTVTTGKYSLPITPTNVQLNISQNQYLLATWTNGTDTFDHLTVAITATNASHVTTTVLPTTAIGTTESYLCNAFQVQSHLTYQVSVISVDASGNESLPATASLLTTSTQYTPPGPQFTVNSEVGYISVVWSPSFIENAASYNIYRCQQANNLSVDSFLLLDTVEADQTEFDDHAVIDNVTYGYIVTVVDTYGNESLSPSIGAIPLTLSYTSSFPNTLLPSYVSLSGTASGNSYTLTWTTTDDIFDGYEIWRSVNNIHSFTLLGTVDASATSFTDTNGLIQNGTYNYMVREYRNDCGPIVSGSSALPPNATLLATVLVSGGSISPLNIDNSVRVVIAGLQTPVTLLTQTAIAAHHHTYNSPTDDRRIDLSPEWTVSDWTTEDNTVYVTEQNLSLTSTFTVFIDGLPAALLYQLDTSSGTLTFGQSLPSSSVVTVVFDDMGEVQGTLPANKIADLSADNFSLGMVPMQAMPEINHDGRIGEPLVPVATTLATSDNLYFTVNDGFSQIGTTFFDMIVSSDNTTLVAATSAGVSGSTDFGNTWNTLGTFVTPVSRVFYAAELELYVALVGNTVYCATSLLTDWTVYPGIDPEVKRVRDIAEDASGFLYITTDLGVYVMDPTLTTLRWQQRLVLNYRSSDCFAVFYDAADAQVIVSSDTGIFYTTNAGLNWSVWNAFPNAIAVNQFLSDTPDLSTPSVSYLYALTDTTLWRKKNTDTVFVAAAELPASTRRLAVFNTLAYIATEAEVLTSTAACSTDLPLQFVNILPQLSEGGASYDITCLVAIDEPSVRLMLGSDGMLFTSGSTGVTSLQFEEIAKTYPTFFVDGQRQRLGLWFNSSMVTFDDRLDPDATVAVATNYSTYAAVNGGWADINFQCPITVYNDGLSLNVSANSIYPSSGTLSSVTLPSLNSRNSIQPDASNVATDAAAALQQTGTQFTGPLVATALYQIEQLEALLYPGTTIAIPPITVILNDGSTSPVTVGSVDAVAGIFSFINNNPNDITQLYPFSKYNVLTADILGTSLYNTGSFTHAQLDDLFELTLSGLPANLAAAKQINGVKRGMFIESLWPSAHDEYCPNFQANYFVSCPSNTPSWYDKFNSTVDYRLRVRQENANISLQYAAAVLYVPDRNDGEVWVAGLGGIIAINVATLVVSVVLQTSDFVQWMFRNNTDVLVTTDTGLYAIAVSDLTVMQDSGIGLPAGLTSVAVASNNIVVGGSDGIYYKSQTGVWQNVQSATSPVVYYLGDLLLSYDNNNNVYSSPGGAGWTLKGNTDQVGQNVMVINRATKYRGVYFATENGLYTDNSTFYSQQIATTLVNVTGSAETSALLVVNDVESDGTNFVIGLADSTYYLYNPSSGFGSQITVSGLDTIQKVALVAGDVWFFGFDKMTVLSSGATIKLTTGNRLTWQQ